MKMKLLSLGFRTAAESANPTDREQRYLDCIEQIRNAKEAWTLCVEDGDSVVMDACGKECICLWPNRDAVQHFLQEVPSEGMPYRVGMDELMQVSKELAEEGEYAYIVSPAATSGCVVSPQQFWEDLTGEDLTLMPRRNR